MRRNLTLLVVSCSSAGVFYWQSQWRRQRPVDDRLLGTERQHGLPVSPSSPTFNAVKVKAAVALDNVRENLSSVIREKSAAAARWRTVPWNSNWDGRQPTPEQVEQNLRPKATRHLFLIRHGAYNLQGKHDGDRYLTPKGLHQAELLAARLDELGYRFESITSSTMTRAMQTSIPIREAFPSIPYKTCDLLREGFPFPVEPPLYVKPDDLVAEHNERIDGAFQKHIHRADIDQQEDSYQLIVCHANVIRYLVLRALQLPPEGWLRFSLHHCSITWLCIRPSGNVSLRALGDHGFMPPTELSTS